MTTFLIERRKQNLVTSQFQWLMCVSDLSPRHKLGPITVQQPHEARMCACEVQEPRREDVYLSKRSYDQVIAMSERHTGKETEAVSKSHQTQAKS